MSYNNHYRPGGFGHMPVVTKNIIIINVIMYAATVILKQSKNIDLYEYFGLHYHLAPAFKPHQFVTYIFMHGNFMHLFFNMFGVYMFGQIIEQVWGPKRFITFYFLTGFGAAVAHYLVISFSIGPVVDSIAAVQDNLSIQTFESFVNSLEFQKNLTFEFSNEYNSFVRNYNALVNENPGRALSLASQFLIDFKSQFLNSQLVVGASGSLFGLLGAFGMLFPNQLLYVYFLIPIKAKWMVIAYGAFEIISGISNNPGDNVAHFAHIGGLVVGVILVLIWRKKKSSFYE